MTQNTHKLLGGIALVLAALLAVGLIGTASAVVVDSHTVEITDNETQEIVVDAELLEDPAANNATVELYDWSDNVVDNATLSGNVGEYDTVRFNVSTDGFYTAEIVADNTSAIGNTSAMVQSTTTGGVFGSMSSTNQWLMFAGLGAVALGGAYYWREEMDDY